MGVDGGGLVILVGRRAQARYSDPEEWRALIREERLKRGDSIAARRGDETVWLRADEVPELRALFAEAEGEATPAPPSTAAPPPTSTAESETPVPRPSAATPSTPGRTEAATAVVGTPADFPLPRGETQESPAKPAGGSVSERPLAGGTPTKPAKQGVPVALWIIGGVLLFAAAVSLLDGAGPGDDAGAAGEQASVVVHAVRETRVRPEPNPTGNTPLGTLERGSSLTGVWTTGADGARWLRITEGRYAGAYAWGANLGDAEPPELARRYDQELAALQEGTLHAAPEAGSAVLDTVQSGQTLRVLGELSSGWREVARSSGGVGYVPPAVFEPPVDALAELSEDATTFDPEYDPYAAAAPPVFEVPGGAADAAPAPPAPAPPPLIAQPVWLQTPNSGQMAQAMPAAALDRGEGGRAVMECGVDGRGAMLDCDLVSEDPPGLGFGSATLGLARHFRLASADRAGDPVAGRRVRIPVRYSVE